MGSKDKGAKREARKPKASKKTKAPAPMIARPASSPPPPADNG